MNIKGEKLKCAISKPLEDILMEYIDKGDRADVSEITGVGLPTVQKLMRREGVISKRNLPALIELMNIAKKNCQESISRAAQAINTIENKLNTKE